MKKLFPFILLLSSFGVFGQLENRTWVFGDSAGITFQNGINPIPFTSSVQTIESSSAVSDTSGNLLFYSGSTDNLPFNNLIVFNRFGMDMPNGSGIYGYGSCTQGNLIINTPGNINLFYLFSLKSFGNNLNFFYTVIDLSLDSGRGDVTQKNSLLSSSLDLTEKMIAIRHANGRDWWLLLHGSGLPTNKDYIKYLITPYGINGPFTQNIPSSNYHFAGDIVGQMAVTQQGDRIAFAGEGGTLDVLDFDRCSGMLTLRDSLGFVTQSMQRGFYGCSFSPNGNMLYASPDNGWGIDTLFQWDLTTGAKTFIWVSPDSVSMGQHLLGPDGKIYIACAYGKVTSTTLDSANQYLSVINMPDNTGINCNFIPYQTWLGGRRSLIGLPNIPNYSLGCIDGSVCDSLGNVGVGEQVLKKGVKIYPNPNNGYFKVDLNGITFNELNIYDYLGRLVLINKINDPVEHFDLSSVNNGIYTIHFVRNGLPAVIKKISIIK